MKSPVSYLKIVQKTKKSRRCWGTEVHKKVLIDANVILDLFEVSRPFHHESVKVIEALLKESNIELFITSDMISNIFYILNSRYKFGFDNALEVIDKISQVFTVHSVSPNDIGYAIDICKRHIFKDYEDGLQYVCTLHEECTLIISNNPKDFKNASIEIYTTKELYRIWNLV